MKYLIKIFLIKLVLKDILAKTKADKIEKIYVSKIDMSCRINCLIGNIVLFTPYKRKEKLKSIKFFVEEYERFLKMYKSLSFIPNFIFDYVMRIAPYYNEECKIILNYQIKKLKNENLLSKN